MAKTKSLVLGSTEVMDNSKPALHRVLYRLHTWKLTSRSQDISWPCFQRGSQSTPCFQTISQWTLKFFRLYRSTLNWSCRNFTFLRSYCRWTNHECPLLPFISGLSRKIVHFIRAQNWQRFLCSSLKRIQKFKFEIWRSVLTVLESRQAAISIITLKTTRWLQGWNSLH